MAQNNENRKPTATVHQMVDVQFRRGMTRKQASDRNYPTLRTGKTVNYNYGNGSLKKTVSKIYRYFQP